MRYSGIRLFNGNASEIELVYDSNDGVFKGSLHLKEVSTGLYETATIFMLEEAYNQYGAPIIVKPIGSNVGSQFKAEFINAKNTSRDINLITTNLVDDEFIVSNVDSLLFEPQPSTLPTSTTDGIHTLGDSYSKEAIQFTLAINSQDEAGHYRYLRIYDTVDNYLIAEIYVYGETVGEDERLEILLSNFGATLTAKDQFLFKDHDINEVGTDWMLINRKRKELLLELSNIKPFVGTYKALINAIKFFGYNNLTLKEYWLMIDDRSPMFGKMKAVEVPSATNGFVSKLKQVALPSSSYKKTSRFGLFYKLNTPTGSFDEWDMPTVEEAFDFTPDEVIVKLYGLKNKLQREYLPLQAKIIDIIGEGDFYNLYNTNVWNNQNEITSINAGVEPSIKIHQDIIFIEDLEKVSTILEGKSQDFSKVDGTDMATLYTDVEAFYTDYYNLDRSTFKDSGIDLKIGAPLMLECTSFANTWNDAEFTWDDAESFITWDNWWKRNVYELRWTITGPKNWSVQIVGSIDDYLKVALALPYAGKYSIKFEQIDLFNNVTVLRYPDAVEVKMKSIEIYGITKWKDVDNVLWGNSTYKWEDAGGDWVFPQQNTEDVDAEIGTLYLTLDRANYLHDESQGVNFSMVRRYKDTAQPGGYGETTGPYFWKNLSKHTWNDGKHTWWDATYVGMDQTSSFKIISGDIGSELKVNYFNVANNTTYSGIITLLDDLTDPLDTAAFQNTADLLNASTDYVLSKFNYNPIFKAGSPTICEGILVVGKQYSHVYDYSLLEVLTGSIQIEDQVHYKSYNPTYNDIKIIDDHTDLELLSHVTFSVDKSKIPGKVAYSWTIQNNSQNVEDIYYNNKWLTYLFEHKGDYTIKLKVTDVNGNTNEISKNALTIK